MLKLVKLSEEYKEHLFEMMEEWWKYTAETGDTEIVPDSTFFCLDIEQNRFVGALNIRHRLNSSLLVSGGHIGDGVRPSMRRQGVATRMIELALKECKKLGITRVLMTCDKENIASAKSIQNNGIFISNLYILFSKGWCSYGQTK